MKKTILTLAIVAAVTPAFADGYNDAMTASIQMRGGASAITSVTGTGSASAFAATRQAASVNAGNVYTYDNHSASYTHYSCDYGYYCGYYYGYNYNDYTSWGWNKNESFQAQWLKADADQAFVTGSKVDHEGDGTSTAAANTEGLINVEAQNGDVYYNNQPE